MRWPMTQHVNNTPSPFSFAACTFRRVLPNAVLWRCTLQVTDYCYHDGMQFLTAHATFNLMMDRYLQMINPKVALPIWDFMIEAATMGTR